MRSRPLGDEAGDDDGREVEVERNPRVGEGELDLEAVVAPSKAAAAATSIMLSRSPSAGSTWTKPASGSRTISASMRRSAGASSGNTTAPMATASLVNASSKRSGTSPVCHTIALVMAHIAIVAQ